MNKNKAQKFFIGAIIVTLLLAVSGNALAEGITRQITAIYSDIKIYVDGQLISPKDANGQPAEPFIVDGTTYLPVRAIADALGKSVEWDSVAGTVYIGARVDTVQPQSAGASKIAIVTLPPSQNEEEYRSAVEMVKKYGASKVVHLLWPDRFMEEQEEMLNIAAEIAADQSIKALVINQAIPGTCAALDKIKETRSDIFIVCCNPQEPQWDVIARANLILMPDDEGMGAPMVQQAYKMGAKTFIHYSFPRHMAQSLISGRREIMMAESNKLGIEFISVTAPDPMDDIGLEGAQQFILDDVSKKVAKYGKDTAFFSTNCGMQEPLIKAVVDNGAIFPQPCCPSPYHGFPAALGIEIPAEGIPDREYVIAETTRILKEKGALGRVSAWPVPISMLSTNVGVDYAFKWINGEVSRTELDMKVLQQSLNVQAGVKVYIDQLEYDEYAWSLGGRISASYDNWILIREDYLTYGE